MRSKCFSCLISVALFLTTSASCTVSNGGPRTNGHRELAFSLGCNMPCWANIEVGVTTFTEGVGILQKRYGSANVKVGKYDLTWFEPNGNADGVKEGIVSFSNAIASEILLSFGSDSWASVGDLIELLGEPTTVAVSSEASIDIQSKCLGMTLLFPRQGVQATLDTSGSSKAIHMDQSISIVRIISPGSDAFTIYDARVVEWQGYRDYFRVVSNSP